MNAVFNTKLYWEGVKKIKVIGIAYTAISAILSALIPFIDMLNWLSYEEQFRSNSAVTAMMFAVPALLIMIPASLIIVLNMFSYLNKRSESDFYHAIPYKRSCVYISFMAACLSWLVFGALLSTASAAFLWWIHPGATVALSIPFLNLGICILLGATLAATAVVAMTITGTSISNLLIIILMICFVPVVGVLFITSLDEIIPLLYVPLTPLRILLPEFSLPIAVFEVMMVGYDESFLFGNAPMIVYTVIVTLAMLVIGCFTYMHRKSEMASKSAPNRLLQHVYRCAVTLPFALFAVMFIIMEGDFTAFIVFVVIALLVYFMYELITTKSFKNLAKAIPFLIVPVVGCLIFFGGTQLAKALTLAYTPDAEELTSIGKLDGDSFNYYGTLSYEQIKTEEIEIDDPEAMKIVAEALANSVEHIKNDTFYGFYGSSYEQESDTHRYVKITDKSGKVCGRYIRLSESDDKRLDELFLNSEDYANALIEMPTDSEVQNIFIYGSSGDLSDADAQKVWQSLVDEYNALPTEKKLAYKQAVLSNYGGYTEVIVSPDGSIVESEEAVQTAYDLLTSFEIQGTVGTKTFRSDYALRSDFFPKTCTLFAELVNTSKSRSYTEEYYGDHSTYEYTYGSDNMKEILPLIESDRINYFNLYFQDIDSFWYDVEAAKEYPKEYLSAEQIAALRTMVEYLLNNIAPADQTDRYLPISLSVTLDNYELEQTNETIICLTDETYKAFQQMLDDYYKQFYNYES